MMYAAIRPIAKPPKKPSHVFFGECLSKSLCFPKLIQKLYATVSFAQSININANGKLKLKVLPINAIAVKKQNGIMINKIPK